MARYKENYGPNGIKRIAMRFDNNIYKMITEEISKREYCGLNFTQYVQFLIKQDIINDFELAKKHLDYEIYSNIEYKDIKIEYRLFEILEKHSHDKKCIPINKLISNILIDYLKKEGV